MNTKVALLAMLSFASAASAQITSAPQDLLVGFREAGVSTDYVVDLGNIGNYYNLAPNTTLDLSSKLSATDLGTAFGSSWSGLTSPALGWSAAATTTTTGASVTLNGGTVVTDKTVWVSQLDKTGTIDFSTAASTPTSLYHTVTALSGGNNRVNAMTPLYVGTGNGTNGSGIAGASVSTATFENGTVFGSWNYQQNNGSSSPTTSFNSFNPIVDTFSTTPITAGAYSVVDLYEYQVRTSGTGSGVYIGSLELGSDGKLFFTNFVPGDLAAIPEPSTFGAILGAAALGFVMMRRRQQIPA